MVERRSMVDSDSPLSITRQCKVLGIHRSGIYYENSRFENYQNGRDMAFGLGSFLMEYNRDRRHSSLGNEMPEAIYNDRRNFKFAAKVGHLG